MMDIFPQHQHHRNGRENGTAFTIIAEIHDPGFAVAVAKHPAQRREHQHDHTADCQVQTLQESIASGYFKDIETDRETVQHRSQFGNKRTQEDQIEIAAVEQAVVFLWLFCPNVLITLIKVRHP